MQQLIVVTTGGTIDKIYFDEKSEFQIGAPAIGEILRGLREAQAAGQVRSRAGALRWLRGAVVEGRAHRKSIAHPTG